MSSFEPQSFGKYFLVDKIATGGMAEIFKAKTFSHGGFENLLVIKRILGHLSDNEDFVEMFIDEAKVSVSLQHANIVRVYDFGKVLDNYYIAMECVDGKDIRVILRRLAKQRRYLPIDFALFIVHELCRGLNYAHSKTDLRGHPFGIVHRDMSPSNVLISYEGDVKIADFGIAKAEQNTYNTADGVLKGKFEYMSPEQASGQPIDARSDLFAVGILFYEMLTGRRLFKGESDAETLERIKRAEIRPPSEVTPRVTPEIERITLKLLAASPDDRYPTAAKVMTDVRALLGRSPDEIRPELRQFLRDLFRDDIDQEIARLEAGSAIAAAWRSTADESLWDGNTTTSGTLRPEPAPPRRRRSPFLLIGLLLLFLLVGGLGAIAAIALLNAPQPDPVASEVIDEPAMARLSINVLPAAKIFLNGEPVGDGTTLRLDGLAAGDYVVRLVAGERDPFEQTITLEPGGDGVVQHTFEGLPAAVPAPAPAPASRPRAPAGPGKPTITFESEPSGAAVVVDGRTVGATPLRWTAEPDRGYRVELQLEGYQRVSASLEPLAEGSSVPFRRTLQPVPATKPGTLTIGIIGGGWGDVFIDGTRQAKPAPGRYTIAPGSRTIRVVNPELLLDYSETVTVGSGQAIKINARP